MAEYFFDTSAIVKYYHEEAGRKTVLRLMEEPSRIVRISRLSFVEWHSAFTRHVRMVEISEEEFHVLQKRFRSDLRTRVFHISAVRATHFDQAARMLSAHATVRNLRTLDALQLAVALDAHQRSPLDAFVCADAALCETARQEGLTVINPETE